MEPLNKTGQLLKYFAQQYRESDRKGIPRKRLIKMAFLADLLAREYLGHALTEFNYYYHHYGPYDSAIEDVVGELVTSGYAETRESWESDEVFTKRLCDLGVPYAYDFTASEAAILAYVAENYLPMPMKELLEDVVYASAPMRAATKSQPVPMDIVNHRGRDTVGFELDAVLEAARAIDEGRYFTDFMS